MSRSVSTQFRRAIQSRELGDPILVLVTIDHPSMGGSPIRVTSDSVNTTSNGETYIPYAFEIGLPDERPGSLPEVSLTIDNVDQVIVNAARSIGDGYATVRVQIVLASDPDQVEVDHDELELSSVEYDEEKVTGRITVSRILDQPFPADQFTPTLAPGLFT